MNVNGRHYRTIWTEGSGEEETLLIIDQTALPHEFRVVALHSVDDVCRAVREMLVRGAGLIGATAAWGVWIAARTAPEGDFAAFMAQSMEKLRATRPTASNLVWALERQKKALAGLGRKEAVEAAHAEAQTIADEDAEFCRRIGEHGLGIIRELAARKGGQPVNILTHCNAGWLAFVDHGSALSPVYAAFNAGIPVHVWVDETRPRNQGASLTAWELGMHGVPHDLIADNAGGHLMQHGMVDMVITGADRIGIFLDRALPEYLAIHDNLALSGRLAGQLRGNAGLPELEFSCRMTAKLADGWAIEYTLTGAGVPADWKSCLEAAKSGTGFLALPGAGMVKLSPALMRFFPAAGGAIRKLDPIGRTFEVASFAAEYFTFLVRDIPGAVVPELAGGGIYDASTGYDLTPDFRFEGTLRKYQEEGVRFLQYMTDRKYNVILADEMGLGKTVQLLALLASRKKRGMAPALIVCPASLIDNWAREAARFVPEFKVASPHDGAERDALWKSLPEYDLVILSYAAARLSGTKLKHYSFSFVVLDEAQHIKNPGSSNAKNCKSIDGAHRIVLTGTPLENSPEDLWSIFDFLQPGILGSLSGFRKYYAGIKDDPQLQRDLAARIAPFVKRRTKAMVTPDLPPKLERTIYCEMEPDQRELYNAVLEEGRRKLRAFKKDDARGNAAIFSTLLRLRQICCHPALLPDGEGSGVSSAKMELLLELLHEHFDSNHKVLLFSQFTSLLALAIPELEKNGIPFEYLDGGTRNRQQHVDHFNNDPSIPLFLLIFSSLMNIVLDLIAVVSLGMGVAGAAWATLISQAISAVLSFAILMRIMEGYEGKQYVLFDFGIFCRMSSIAVPSVIQQATISFGMMLVQSVVNLFGSQVLAGYSAAIRVDSLAGVPLSSMGNAMSPYTAQNAGAGYDERVGKGFRSGMLYIVIFGIAICSILQIFRSGIMELFLGDGGTALAYKTGKDYIAFLGWFYPILGFAMVTGGVLRGLGHMKWFMLGSILNLSFRVIGSMILAPRYGVEVVWYVVPVGWTIYLVTCLVGYFRIRRTAV